MKIVSQTDRIFFGSPSEYKRDKLILKCDGWLELKKSFILTANGIYSTFVRNNE